MIVRRFGAWRFVVAFIVCVAGVALGTWAVRAAATHPLAFIGSLLVFGLCATLLARQVFRLQAVSLRWYTQRWHLGPAGMAGHEPVSGQVAIALDLGGWMLLRFLPEAGLPRRRGVWLPVQRRGHEAAWPALRSTVYCARPVPLPAVAPF